MKHVLAALDNSLTAQHVAEVARRLGDLSGADVHAIHVSEDGARTARAAADQAGLTLELREGVVGDVLADVARHADVVVLGSRDRPQVGEPIGHIARDLIMRVATPVLLVPPTLDLRGVEATMLIPLDGSEACGDVFTRATTLVDPRRCSIVGVYVFEDAHLPAFADQVHHEAHAWTETFLRRHCGSTEALHLELRVGHPADQVLRVAHEQHAMFIAIGWSQELTPGRAHTVRALLAQTTIPLLLFPVPTHASLSQRASQVAL